MVGKGVSHQSLQSQVGRQSPQSSRAEPPVASAKGDQHGVEHPSGVWSSAVSAGTGACLSYTLKVVISTLLVS